MNRQNCLSEDAWSEASLRKDLDYASPSVILFSIPKSMHLLEAFSTPGEWDDIQEDGPLNDQVPGLDYR